jgi:hypothetical protein
MCILRVCESGDTVQFYRRQRTEDREQITEDETGNTIFRVRSSSCQAFCRCLCIFQVTFDDLPSSALYLLNFENVVDYVELALHGPRSTTACKVQRPISCSSSRTSCGTMHEPSCLSGVPESDSEYAEWKEFQQYLSIRTFFGQHLLHTQIRVLPHTVPPMLHALAPLRF